jgi:hypothetical protein
MKITNNQSLGEQDILMAEEKVWAQMHKEHTLLRWKHQWIMIMHNCLVQGDGY